MTPEAEVERAHWDTKADSADPMFEMWADTPKTIQCLNLLLEDFDPAGSVGAKILDLGCGIGRLAQATKERFMQSEVYGVDISPKLIEIARAEAPGPHYYECDGRSLPDEIPNDLDYAYSMVVFQHIPNDAKAAYLKAVANKLKINGIFRFQFVEGTEQTAYNHHATQLEVINMCEAANLEVEAIDRELMFKNWLWFTVSKL